MNVKVSIWTVIETVLFIICLIIVAIKDFQGIKPTNYTVLWLLLIGIPLSIKLDRLNESN